MSDTPPDHMSINPRSPISTCKNYELIRVVYHRPSEFTVDGKTFDMDAQLVHKSEDGKQAIVTVLLEKGAENPVVQMALNNLPLDKGGEVALPARPST